MSSLDQTQAISEGRLHVGFVALPIDDAGLATETVMRQPIMIALPPDHPLAKRERVPLQALSGEPQIMFARSKAPRFFDAVLAACREAGFSMNIAHEVDNLYTACALGRRRARRVPGARRRAGQHSQRRWCCGRCRRRCPVEMHIALAYKPQSESELVPLFVDVVKDVVAKQARPKPMRPASV